MPTSTSEPWEEGLPGAAGTLRNLLRNVDSASAPLWSGPQLDAAVFRYTEIFLPMLSVHLGGRGYIGETEIRHSTIKTAANDILARDYSNAKNSTMYKRELSGTEERTRFLAPFHALNKNCASIVRARLQAIVWKETRNNLRTRIRECRERRQNTEHNCALTMVVFLTKIFPGRKQCTRARKTFLPGTYGRSSSHRNKTTGDVTEGKERPLFRFDEATWWTRRYTYPLKYDIKSVVKRLKQFM